LPFEGPAAKIREEKGSVETDKKKINETITVFLTGYLLNPWMWRSNFIIIGDPGKLVRTKFGFYIPYVWSPSVAAEQSAALESLHRLMPQSKNACYAFWYNRIIMTMNPLLRRYKNEEPFICHGFVGGVCVWVVRI
jgi:hypothetical protein